MVDFFVLGNLYYPAFEGAIFIDTSVKSPEFSQCFNVEAENLDFDLQFVYSKHPCRGSNNAQLKVYVDDDLKSTIEAGEDKKQNSWILNW